MAVNPEVVIIGGGAAGFFCAIQIAEQKPGTRICILEKSNKVLSKVLVSGGGRCNLLHDCPEPKKLLQYYPRGNPFLRKAFQQFGQPQCLNWFHNHGLKTHVEADGRMFPITNRSETVAQLFFDLCRKHSIEIRYQTEVSRIESGFILHLKDTSKIHCRFVVVATGGAVKTEHLDFLSALDIKKTRSIPSLFTFNIPDSPLKDLSGLSVPQARVRLSGSKQESIGPLLVTHWGLSGPAVLRLSAFEAIHLFDLQYQAQVLINWVYPLKEDQIRNHLLESKQQFPNKKVQNIDRMGLPERLWLRMLEISEIDPHASMTDISNKKINVLTDKLGRMELEMKGKTTFKEEFVTAGGIDTETVDAESLESKRVAGLYFCGEVLNVDGVTGGFNFQAAWSTAYAAAKNIASKL